MGVARFFGFGPGPKRGDLRGKASKANKKKAAHRRRRRPQIEQCEPRLLLSVSTPLQLVSISPYETSILGTTPPANTLIYGPGAANTVMTQAPSELVLDFNQGQNIDPKTLGAIQVIRSGGDNQFQEVYNSTTGKYSTNANNSAMDVQVPIGSVTINQTFNTTTGQYSNNEVVVRFSQDLPADFYEVVIVGRQNSLLDDRPAAQQTPLESYAVGSTTAPRSGV